MKSKYQLKQIGLLCNQVMVICFFVFEYLNNIDLEIEIIFPMILVSIMIIGSSYIQFNNLNNSYVLSAFSSILLFFAWVIMMLKSSSKELLNISMIMYIFLPYVMIRFMLFFLFQDARYLYKNKLKFILATCIVVAIGYLIDDKIFALFFLIQCLLNIVIVVYILIQQLPKVLIIIKQEIKNIICSFIIIVVPFFCYIWLNHSRSIFMDNIGVYIIISLPTCSIYNIIRKKCKEISQYYVLKYTKNIFMATIIIGIVVFSGILFELKPLGYFILLHLLTLLVMCYLTFVYSEMKIMVENHKSKQNDLIRNNFYLNNILHITREEKIKKQFSNYLHDQVLQSLLSIKNLINKADKQQVRDIILKIICQLNQSIRDQMEIYYPPILQKLSFKENIKNLMELLNENFYSKKIKVSLECDDTIYIIEPYNLIIYRIIRELVTNAFKHSNGKHITVTVIQDHDKIMLMVKDDGDGMIDEQSIDISQHNGLFSIKQQICDLGGNIEINSEKNQGLKVKIQIVMKGDFSYEHFINR